MIFVLIALAGGVVAGLAAHRFLVCAPSCRGGVYLWTPEQERAAWERGVSCGVDYARGETMSVAGRRDIAGVLAAREARTVDEDDQGDQVDPLAALRLPVPCRHVSAGTHPNG